MIAVPVVGSIGYAGLSSTTALIVATFFAGALVLGIQSGINVVGAMIYPTSLRAAGSGWQLGIGRLGAIVGPFLGALFVGLPVNELYMWSALPFAGGAVVAFLIYALTRRGCAPARIWRKRSSGAAATAVAACRPVAILPEFPPTLLDPAARRGMLP